MKDVTTLINNYKKTRRTYQIFDYIMLAQVTNENFFKKMNKDIVWEQSDGNLFAGNLYIKNDKKNRKLFEMRILFNFDNIAILLTTIYESKSINIVNELIYEISSIHKDIVINHYCSIEDLYKLRTKNREEYFESISLFYESIYSNTMNIIICNNIKYFKIFDFIINLKTFKFTNIKKLLEGGINE